MLKDFFKFEKWFGIIILAAFMNMALFSYDALCAPALSRDKAATLIQKSLSEVKTKVRLHDSGYQKGLQHGMWQTHEKSTYVTDHGAQYFQSLNYSADFWGNFAAQASGSGSGSVTLKKPVNVRVKVTGIRGGSAAEFTWEYVGLPSVVKRYVVRGGNGTAQFTLYDDGWRLTNVNHKYSNEPAIQTAKEHAEEEAETRAWEAAERKRQEQQNTEKERLANLVRESQTPTREIASFSFHTDDINQKLTLKVTDVGFSVEEVEIYNKSSMQPSKILFSDPFWQKIYATYFYVKPVRGSLKRYAILYNTFYLFQFDTYDEAIKVYEVISSANKQWREKYHELVNRP